MKWISVDDRLPEESGKYLVFWELFPDDFTSICVAEFNLSLGWIRATANQNRVTHWQPLPDPPQMEKKCNK